jgi:hypothetical protein
MNKTTTYLAISMTILFLITSNIAIANTQYRTVSLHGKNTNVTILVINGSEYAPLDKITKKIFAKSKYDVKKHEVTFGKSILRSSPSSFFIAYKSAAGMKVAQMSLPAIIYNNILYVPFNSFLSSLQILEIYSVKFISNKFYISKYKGMKRLSMNQNVEKKNIDHKPKPHAIKIIEQPNTTATKKVAKQNELASEMESIEEAAADENAPNERNIIENQSPRGVSASNTLKKSIYQSKRAINSGLDELIKMTASDGVKKTDPNSNKVDLKQYPPNVYVIPPDLKRKELNQ